MVGCRRPQCNAPDQAGVSQSRNNAATRRLGACGDGGNPRGSLPHHLQRDVSAHRDSGQGETFWRGREDTRDDGRNAVIEARVGDHTGRGIGEPFDDGPSDGLVEREAGNENEGDVRDAPLKILRQVVG